MSDTKEYFRRARLLYPKLGIEIKQSEQGNARWSQPLLRDADNQFLRIIGLAPSIRESWAGNGIRPVYWKILEILERSN
jgi:hypothetical protein